MVGSINAQGDTYATYLAAAKAIGAKETVVHFISSLDYCGINLILVRRHRTMAQLLADYTLRLVDLPFPILPARPLAAPDLPPPPLAPLLVQ